MDGEAKTCRKCGTDKLLSDFNRRSDARDGLQSYCRSCEHTSYRERVRRHIEEDAVDYKLREMLKQAKARATRDGLPFNLDLDYMILIAVTVCPVLNIELTFNAVGTVMDSSPTLDRFYPELGYVKGNVFLISSKANTMKSYGTLQEHWRLLCWMAETERQLDIGQELKLKLSA